MMSRTIVTSIGLSAPLRMILSRILVLTGPRIFSTAWLRVRPCTWLVVEMGDDVVRHHAGLGGGRVVDRRNDLDQAVLHRHFDAKPAELAAGLDLHVLEALGVHVARVRIEPVEHAVDRVLDELAVVRLLDVVGAHPLEHVAEQIELPVGVRRSRLGARAEHASRLRGVHRDRSTCHCAEENQVSLAHHPRTFSLSVAAHHGPGSTGVPSLRNST